MSQLPMNVVVCTDENFVAHTATLLQSIRSTISVPVNVFFLASLSKISRERLVSLESKHFHIQFISNLPDYSSLPISERFKERFSEAGFYRLAIPTLLPHLDKALYLDSDMISVDDIADIWEQDLSENAACVVRDSLLCTKENCQELGLEPESYFNSGMMLLNLDYWRKASLTDRVVQLVKDNPQWDYNDQHALNVALKGAVKYIDPIWNIQTNYLLTSGCPNPRLIHFTGFEKPWHATSAHPYTTHYREFRKQTNFKAEEFPLVLDNYDKEILNALSEHFPSKKTTIGIWGAGMRGRRLISYLKKEMKHIEIAFIVDKYINGSYEDVPISKKVPNVEVDAIIIATIPHKKDVIRALPGNVVERTLVL